MTLKQLSWGPTDVIFHVLHNTTIFDKSPTSITLEDIGALEGLYYATCAKLKECLYEVTTRLENCFIEAEDKYITYNSEGFGIDFATAGDFRAILLSYEAFLYSSAVIDLLRMALKEKHSRIHHKGSRPILLDPRKMACGMIFGTLKERHRIALLDQQFDRILKTLPADAAALHWQKRHSTGLRMRKKSFKRSPLAPRLPADCQPPGEEPLRPLYLEYLDEYTSVASIYIDKITTDSDCPSCHNSCTSVNVQRNSSSSSAVDIDWFNAREEQSPMCTSRADHDDSNNNGRDLIEAMKWQEHKDTEQFSLTRSMNCSSQHERRQAFIQHDQSELPCI